MAFCPSCGKKRLYTKYRCPRCGVIPSRLSHIDVDQLPDNPDEWTVEEYHAWQYGKLGFNRKIAF